MPTDTTADSFGSNLAIFTALNLASLTVIFFLKYQCLYIYIYIYIYTHTHTHDNTQ